MVAAIKYILPNTHDVYRLPVQSIYFKRLEFQINKIWKPRSREKFHSNNYENV